MRYSFLVIVRVLIALATNFQWHLHQLDVNNAFLHGFLHDDIYMTPSQGYKQAKSGEVCKLVKSLYGTKQASREWNTKFCKALISQGYIQSTSDPYLFYKGRDDTCCSHCLSR